MSVATLGSDPAAASAAVNPPAPAGGSAPAPAVGAGAPPAAAPATPASTPAPAPVAAEPAKPGEAAKAPAAAAPDVPFKWEGFKEGQHKPAPELLGGVEKFAKAHGIAEDKAVAFVGEMQSAIASHHAAEVKGWGEQLKKNAEFAGAGGEKLQASIDACGRCMDKFGTPELRQWFKTSGYGNHPDLALFVKRVGDAMGEDVVVTGNEPAPAKVSLGAKLWPGVGPGASQGKT